VLIAAAGNDGPKARPRYPGADKDVVAVTATDASDDVTTDRSLPRTRSLPANFLVVNGPSGEFGRSPTPATSLSPSDDSGIEGRASLRARATRSPAEPIARSASRAGS
jgi:hypothetical protein